MNLLNINTALKSSKMKKKVDWNGRLPKHIAIMMDGNGRWATKRGLPRTAGHFAGMQTMRNTIEYCQKNKVDFLTLYAFSTENWKRPQQEVDYIISLVQEFVTDKRLSELNKNNVKIKFIGDISRFNPDTQKIMNNAVASTSSNSGMTVNFAMNYGGRDEIIQAVKSYLGEIEGEPTIEELEKYLYTSECPHPELIIRTSGEKRLSGFLLWQSAQSELWFTDEMWPSFNEFLFYKAIYDYQCRLNR